MVEKGKICRFCLGQNGLTLLSKTLNTGFTFEDVVYCTGIEISKNEEITICHECCTAINYAVNFRRTCLNNDIIFKKLVTMINLIGKDDTITSAAAKDASPGIHTAKSVGFTRTDDDIIALDDSESNDSTSFCVQPVSEEIDNTFPQSVITNPPCTEEEPPEIYQKSDVEALDGNDSDYSVPSLYEEAIKEALDKKNIGTDKDESTKCSYEDRTQATDCECIKGNSETSTNWSIGNRIPVDSSDSDDSITSLYTEWMEKYSGEPYVVSTSCPIHCGTTKRTAGLCPYCGLMTSQYVSHVSRQHAKLKKLDCPHCPKKFTERFHLKRHINTSHERRIILTCPQCGKGFVNHSSYTYHMVNSHIKSAIYECETCNRKLKSWDGYKKHLKEHSLAVLKCLDCGKLYKTMFTLEQHKLRYHPS